MVPAGRAVSAEHDLRALLVQSAAAQRGSVRTAVRQPGRAGGDLQKGAPALDALLDSSVRLLGQGGRMAVITFHSLEDRRVKQFFELRSRPEIDRPEWPAPRPNPDYCFRPLSRKPVTAGEEELSINPRSRSAKLRGVEKII